MPIVSNSSPLIALARIQRLDLVPAVLQSILIPPAVAREIEPSVPVLPAWVSVKVLSNSPYPYLEDALVMASARRSLSRSKSAPMQFSLTSVPHDEWPSKPG